jgi:DNA-binding NarL/FixJ family response regulator
MINVAIIDDNSKSRKELVNLIAREPDLCVVMETNLIKLKELEEKKPDVIRVDNKQPFTEGLGTTEVIVSKFEHTKVIVLSVDSKSIMLPLHSKRTVTASSCLDGACYHLCQDCSAEDLLAAIKIV